ncbi:amidohydrolase [Kribbella sp. NPDC004875]|uniref:amidohydrolase n=1 Tax=Kribbella sp. NPDC004875 TaxID=3364107 RepID=UPI00369E14F9
MTTPSADLLLTGGTVHTLDDAGTIAEAVAVRAGTIIAVGSRDELRQYSGPATRAVDLAGRTVVPGLIDSHCHFEDAGLDHDTVGFEGVTTLAEALDRIRAHAATLPTDSWVRGRMWNPANQLAERRAPNRHELDAATGGRPVYLPFGHSAAASTAALRAAGLDERSDHPASIVDREAGGHPSGHLIEDGMQFVARVVPVWTDEQRTRQLADAMAVLNAHGITSVVAGATARQDVEVLAKLDGRSTLRVAAMVTPSGELNPSVSASEWSDLLAGGPRPASPWLQERGIKLQIDGGMTLGTAATRDPYANRDDYHGELIVDRSRLTELVTVAHRSGWPVGIHVVGDAAIDLALDVMETSRTPGLAPDVLIHASLIQPDQIKRAAALGVLVAAQTPFLWRNVRTIEGHLGRQRTADAVPLRDLVDVAGLGHVAAGTDYPINRLAPFQNIYAMTTRADAQGVVTGTRQAVSRAEALALYTRSGAAHTGELHRKGTIEPGKYADLAVLDRDPLTVDDKSLLETQVELTLVAGQPVFDPHQLS